MNNVLLRSALAANAAFSLTCGCGLAVFGGPAARMILTNDRGGGWALRGLGVGLIAFAVLLATMARDRGVERSKVAPIVISDLVWVALSAALILFARRVLTDEGRVVVGVIAAVVALLASLQWYGGRLTARSA